MLVHVVNLSSMAAYCTVVAVSNTMNEDLYNGAMVN